MGNSSLNDLETFGDSEGAAESRLTPLAASDLNTEVPVHKSEKKSENPDEFVVKYRGKKYDIKNLLKKHPGGSKILNSYKGLSIDDAMVANTHSVAAFHLFEEFVQDNQDAYQEIERLVDWNAPLLSQVGSLGDRYWEWVNLPVNRPIRLFASDIMERLTVTPWYTVPIVWIPVYFFFLYRGYFTDLTGHAVESVAHVLISLGWGVLLWTLLEYVLHRKLFHMKPSPDSKTLITLHFLLHGLHHKAPFDGQRLVFPPIPGIFVAVLIYTVYELVIPFSMIDFVAAGTVLGYLCYDMTHYYLHYGAPKAETYMYVMKRYHNYHHFSHHEEGFGISSRLWDYVFGTMIALRNLKKAIEW